MKHGTKVDESLKERHGILKLLERLDNENITVGEMEEIGGKLKKAGHRALVPLVRCLWREKDGELLTKYAYLLDFFDDDAWLDQLIQITLKRTDLGDEGKSALLAALESYGIDVASPPFSHMLADLSGPLRSTLPRLFDKGDAGYLCVLDDFVNYDLEVQLGLIRELPTVKDERIMPLMDMLLGFETQEVVAETLTTLGRVRLPGAVRLLKEYLAAGGPALFGIAARSLKRLEFLGLDTSLEPEPPLYEGFHAVFITPIDGTGNRSVWICRPIAERLDAVYLQIHETRGMLDALSYTGMTAEEFDKLMEEVGREERLLPVKAETALLVICDSLNLNRENQFPYPPEFYLRRSMFKDLNVFPAPYIPEFPGYNLEEIASSTKLVKESPQLLDNDLLEGWLLTDRRVYDLADQWNSQEENDGREAWQGRELLLRKICAELVKPEIERLSRRLLLTADLMQRTGGEREDVERALAAGLSIASKRISCHTHPFLRRLGLDSIEAACDAMAEGFDMRLQPDPEMEEWE